jgi:hypothetical protein
MWGKKNNPPEKSPLPFPVMGGKNGIVFFWFTTR